MTTARLLLLLLQLLLLSSSSPFHLALAEPQQQQQQQHQQQRQQQNEVTLAAPLRHQQNQRPSFIERRLREHEAQQGAADAVQDQQQQQQTTLGIRHGRSRGRNHGRHLELDQALPTAEEDELLLQPMFYQPSELWNSSGAVYELAEQDSSVENSSAAIQQQEQQQQSISAGIASGSGGGKVDIVTRFLRIIENQHLLGENCTAGTDLNLGEGVVDQYAQERFRLEANLAVNRANMLTRLWKYAPEVMSGSEYLLHASVLSMVEFDEDIFAAGNCYDKLQYRERWLYCPFAHRLQDEEGVLVKDLAVEYKYLSNSSEWFYIARKNAERRIASYNQFSRGYHTYTHNESSHTERIEDEILTVRYEDGRWSKPYYDCGGGNIWMLTYTVPFFGYSNDTYYFKGTSGIDIDLRRVDIDQCPLPPGSMQLNIFAASDKCKKRTTECVAISGLGFRRGSYRCICKRGFYYPDTKSTKRYYNGTVIEEEYEKLMLGKESQYAAVGVFECLPCAEGCESCEDGSPCVVSLNWLMRTAILILECCVIACLPAVVLFTWKYGNVKVVRAASPVLLRVIVLGAFFIYCTLQILEQKL